MRVVSTRRYGFTLIEMLVTLTILAILAGVAIPLAHVAVKREKEIELRRNLRVDEDSYGYPPDLETLVKGVEVEEIIKGKKVKRIVRFLRRIPKDPMTNSYDWGLRSYQDDPDSDVWGGENVYDVYTKSRATALDGTKYREW